VLRVNIDPSGKSLRKLERRLEPLWLRKPIRSAALRVALEAGLARLRRFSALRD
jgi:hypothetical protein